MTRSVYVIGGAGTGKSTFMAQLMDEFILDTRALSDIYESQNAQGSRLVLRGHDCISKDVQRGVYLGCLRDQFPGTDGLDRASSKAATEWLRGAELSGFIIAEGATLTTTPFLLALDDRTDLLLVHLWAEPFVRELRYQERGSNQDASWILNSITRAANMAKKFENRQAQLLTVDSADPAAWSLALAACLTHLEGTDQ